jgi:anaerobic glycerol-3-phosphate dehydrogenase
MEWKTELGGTRGLGKGWGGYDKICLHCGEGQCPATQLATC